MPSLPNPGLWSAFCAISGAIAARPAIPSNPARRFAPVILPSAFLLMAAAAFYGTWARRRQADATVIARAVEWAVPVAFVAVVATLLLRASGSVRAHVEYEGLLSRIENLSHQFSSRDLVVVESRAQPVHLGSSIGD